MGSSEKVSHNRGAVVPAPEKKRMPYWLLGVCIAEAVVAAVLALLVVIPTHIPYPTSTGEEVSQEKAMRAAIAQAEAYADNRDSTLQYYKSALKRVPNMAWAGEINRRIKKTNEEYDKHAREALEKLSVAFENFVAQEEYARAETELGGFPAQFKDSESCKNQIAAMRARLSLLVEAREKCYEVIAAAEDLWRKERASEALELLSTFPAKYQDTLYARHVKTKKDEIESYVAQREEAEKRRQEEAAELQRRAEEDARRAREEAEKRWIEEQMKRAEEERKKAEEEKLRAEEEARAKEAEHAAKEQEEDGEPWTAVQMKPFSQSEFPFTTPFPADSALAAGPQATATLKFLPLPNEGRKSQHAVQDNQSSIEVDTDADGVVDRRLPPQGGVVTVKVFYGEEEGEASYTVQISRVEGALRFRRHSFTAGKFQNTKLFLIDEDNNGRFNDYGTDALAVGNNPCACTLANVMAIGEKLFEMKVSVSGKKLSLRPFEAKTGKLNLVSGFKAKSNLLYAIVLGKIKDEKGREHTAAFDLAKHPKGLDIPVGAYDLHAAAVGSGNKLIARIRKTGECKEIIVTEPSPVKVDWGAPARAEFSYDIDSAGNLRVRPDTIRVYGAYGESYYDIGIDEFIPYVQVKNENEEVILTRSFNRSDDGKSLVTFECLVPRDAKLKVRILGKIRFLGDVSSEWK